MAYKERKRWAFFGLPFTFTVYDVKDEILTITQGFLSKKENDCYMYKIQDVTLQASLFERIFGLGTVVCRTGDSTHPILSLIHIKQSREIKDFILKKSEEHRMYRRTVNLQDIGASDNLDNVDNLDLMWGKNEQNFNCFNFNIIYV